jgi:hypothetical protein
MLKQLADEDRRAVDLLLDGGSDTSAGESGKFVAPGSFDPDRVHSVEMILSLLHRLPAGDPPADLAARTLQRVDAALTALAPQAGMLGAGLHFTE